METRTLIGYRRVNFQTDDGRQIHGYNLYYLINMDSGSDQDGSRGDKVYVPDNVLNEMGYTPSVGDQVTICYNRYGKVSKIFLE